MTILVTGAAGFVGQAVARKLQASPSGQPVRLLDRLPAPEIGDRRFSTLCGDLTDAACVDEALEDVSTVIHLASLPGGAAEANPVASRQINLDATLHMLERIDAGPRKVRFVYASSIAVFGAQPAQVDDATLPNPALVYGAHKRMVEIALADFHRRGRVDGIALRLPGIVARPGGSSGLKSAFLSDIFHAARDRRSYVVPVSEQATVWMMSVPCVAGNLLHAAGLEDGQGLALTLPATRVQLGDLAERLFQNNEEKPIFQPDNALEVVFGAYPPLITPKASALGFVDDGPIETLIETVGRHLEEQES